VDFDAHCTHSTPVQNLLILDREQLECLPYGRLLSLFTSCNSLDVHLTEDISVAICLLVYHFRRPLLHLSVIVRRVPEQPLTGFFILHPRRNLLFCERRWQLLLNAITKNGLHHTSLRTLTLVDDGMIFSFVFFLFTHLYFPLGLFRNCTLNSIHFAAFDAPADQTQSWPL